MKSKIQVIMGSTRPTRINKNITKWLVDIVSTDDSVEYEIIDLADWHLPFIDEPMIPMMGDYRLEHTKKWSKKISEADGYIFVTPEYNGGYPAVLKNAIDYLNAEWKDKPVMIASYSFSGGVSASAQLKQVVERLGMKPTSISPAFTNTRDMYGEDGQIKDIKKSYAEYESTVQEANEELLELVNSSAPVAVQATKLKKPQKRGFFNWWKKKGRENNENIRFNTRLWHLNMMNRYYTQKDRPKGNSFKCFIEDEKNCLGFNNFRNQHFSDIDCRCI